MSIIKKIGASNLRKNLVAPGAALPPYCPVASFTMLP
jgi:hypothetical protein